MNKQYQINQPKEFDTVFKEILTCYQNSGNETLVLALKGDLGAGKTTFTQELGKILGVEETITSPTFTIMKKYDLSDKTAAFDLLVHIDAYRIEEESEIVPLRLAEIFQRPKTIVCIEWPEQIESAVPTNAVWVKIKIGKNQVREVMVSQSD